MKTPEISIIVKKTGTRKFNATAWVPFWNGHKFTYSLAGGIGGTRKSAIKRLKEKIK